MLNRAHLRVLATALEKFHINTIYSCRIVDDGDDDDNNMM